MDLQTERPASGWGAFASKVRRMFGRSEVARQPNKDAFVGMAQTHLTVRPSGETRLVEVLYDSPDPKFAAEFANTLVSEFTELGQKLRWEASQRTGDWLTGHLQEMKANLEKQQIELQEYARSSGLNITAESNVADVRLKELQEELDKAQADRVDKQAKYEEAKARPVESLPATLDDPTLRDYRSKLTDLQRQKVELSATLTPEHYKVQRVQAQIDELKSALDRERNNVVKRVGNEYTAASRREKLLAANYEEQQRTVANQSDKSIHYDMMKREVDSNRALYQALLGKVQQASLASAMRASNVLVVDPAKVPFLPYKPNVSSQFRGWTVLRIVRRLGFRRLSDALRSQHSGAWGHAGVSQSAGTRRDSDGGSMRYAGGTQPASGAQARRSQRLPGVGHLEAQAVRRGGIVPRDADFHPAAWATWRKSATVSGHQPRSGGRQDHRG
jgi:uncharacterized protein involved in exopolysaccharide biosynthesis